ncbi:hypothetical protein [Geofilum rhodophaeum]|uniref:hypothetical protein n=1 Tax=Geofilum rhodophaeum TaxID=1965019 RepID=UPI000B522188|nr:hypothetical protein [Geofilum rhodophaeum]
MGIKPKFKYSDIEREVNAELINIERGVLAILQRVGEEFVRDARMGIDINSGAFPKGDYTDQTANLRSSIGYFILRDGEVVTENLTGTSKGVSAARAVLSSVGKQGYSIVGVAGMEYASHLESMGYNVISSQNLNLIVDLSDRLQKFARKAGKKGLSLDFDQSFTGQSSAL